MKTRFDYLGLSTDDKPTEKAVNGSTFREVDTSKLFIFYKGEWYEKVEQGGGSSDYNAKINGDLTYNSNQGLRSIIEEVDMNGINLTNASSIFTYCGNLKTIRNWNTENITELNGSFRFCNSLENISELNTKNCNDFTLCFNGCSSLIDMQILNFKKVQNTSKLQSMFSGCGSLSNESLNNIMASILTAPSYISGTKTLKQIGLTSAQATTCQGLSNYQAFLDAGWTTGY